MKSAEKEREMRGRSRMGEREDKDARRVDACAADEEGSSSRRRGVKDHSAALI